MEINITIDKEFREYVDTGWLENIAKQVLTAQASSNEIEVGLLLIGQKKIQRLNRQYRNIDEPTDVLSFGMLPTGQGAEVTFPSPDGVQHLGEVIISYPQAVKQAEESQHSTKREIVILIIHGILHLLGYDHETPEEESTMRARESETLTSIKGDID